MTLQPIAALVLSFYFAYFVQADEPSLDLGRLHGWSKAQQDGYKELEARLAKLRRKLGWHSDLFADAAIYAKGVSWSLRHDESFSPSDTAMQERALEECLDRVSAIEQGNPSWGKMTGKLVRGYVSQVDDSVQPFGLIVPSGYDPMKPTRLDVVLHGSSKPVGMSELRFMSRFNSRESHAQPVADGNFIELHPLGRVENCYRWAGETDVFDAIEAVCRNYNIDRKRVVLRGMSMGASGTWHLGLKHPDRFVALGPYCGYVDTHQFSLTPIPNFIPVGVLPPFQEKTLHMLDSIDYAANARIVPAIACMGEKDVFFQSHVLMGQAMEREGIKMINLISPGTGHIVDPTTHQEQMLRIEEISAKGIDDAPRQLHFVTWTLKYAHCFWVRVLGLGEHYVRAELNASVNEDGSVDLAEPLNITRLMLLPPVLQEAMPKLRIAGKEVSLPIRGEKSIERQIVIGKRNGHWLYLGEQDEVPLDSKRPGVQGPIDDAFTTRFLCVRGTGQALNPAVKTWSDASLKRFENEWNRYFRGELPLKDDTDVTEDDAKSCNLILFGDPGSNRWIAKLLPLLPLTWTKDELEFGGVKYAAVDHAALMIQPNPLAPKRYVVLNSGHSFGEAELSKLNYLLFPRLGDWAIVQVATGEPVRVGFFDEQWRFGAVRK